MSTQVILTKTIENVGNEGDAVMVSDGYARNYLLPKKLALPATPANMRVYEARRKKVEEQKRNQYAHAQSIAKQLADRSCTITAKAGPDGKLFGSVSAAQIVEAMKSENIELEPGQIKMEHPIREVGVYEVDVKLHAEVTAKLKVWVVTAEGAAASIAGKE